MPQRILSEPSCMVLADQQLTFIESIVETIPDMVFEARRQAWNDCAKRAMLRGLITDAAYRSLVETSPFAPVTAPLSNAWDNSTW